jgi:hypothetical protein
VKKNVLTWEDGDIILVLRRVLIIRVANRVLGSEPATGQGVRLIKCLLFKDLIIFIIRLQGINISLKIFDSLSCLICIT